MKVLRYSVFHADGKYKKILNATFIVTDQRRLKSHLDPAPKGLVKGYLEALNYYKGLKLLPFKQYGISFTTFLYTITQSGYYNLHLKSPMSSSSQVYHRWHNSSPTLMVENGYNFICNDPKKTQATSRPII